MLLTDYFRSTHDNTWDMALTTGVNHGTIRLPEDDAFDLTDKSHWQSVYDRFVKHGITPVVIEPMPNNVHDHIKVGDEKRDQSIEKVIKMFPIMEQLRINIICFNFMAHIGWLRTSHNISERGGAKVTGFNINDFKESPLSITENELWDNYTYFLNAVVPYAEKFGIKLALHPDDPPRNLGNVKRIMTSTENIKRAIYSTVQSDCLGLTMCQSNFYIMGEDINEVIKDFANKIFFIHFRNTLGEIDNFRETFHDSGGIDMAEIMKTYLKYKIDVPIRVDHVPTMPWEESTTVGYDAIGRLFAIGYMKGIIEGCKA